MRFMLLGALALALTACGQREEIAAGDGCALSASTQVTWSSAQAQDTITATAEGPSCANAVLTFVVRTAEGEPIWAVAAPYAELTVGGRTDPESDVAPETVQTFLESWVDVTLNTTEALPAWPEGADTLGGAVEGMAYYTELDREVYESLRTRNLNQLCYAAGVDASQCLVIDPQTNRPMRMVAFGV